MSMKRVYLLTGLPGTGKTRLIKEAVSGLGDSAGGFYTEEIRSSEGNRLGFRLVTLDGQRIELAHIKFKSQQRVGKYGVSVQAMDSVGVPALEEALRDCDVVVVDEIGKMELFSKNFKDAVIKLLDSKKKVLGTIMFTTNPWTDAIKKRADVELLPVTGTNYNGVLGELKEWLSPEAQDA
jgi:nucleoside-triphosphatase